MAKTFEQRKQYIQDEIRSKTDDQSLTNDQEAQILDDLNIAIKENGDKISNAQKTANDANIAISGLQDDIKDIPTRNELNYTIYWELGKTPTIRQNSDKTITVTPNGAVYVRDYLGKEILSLAPPKDESGNIIEYTLLTNQILILDLINKSYNIIGNGDARSSRYVMLANNQYGVITNGKLISTELFKRSSRIGVIMNGTTEHTRVNWDTATGIITFSEETNIRCGNRVYTINKDNRSVDTNMITDSSGFNVFFNTETKAVSIIRWDIEVTGTNMYLLFSGRKQTKELSIYNYSIDGVPAITSNNWSIPTYQLVYPVEPLIEVQGSNIIVTIRSAIYIVLSNGINYYTYSLKDNTPEVYIIPTNNILVFNMLSKNIEVISNNKDRRASYVYLLSNYNGVAVNGQFVNTLVKRSAESLQQYNLIFELGNYPTFETSGNNITVNLNYQIYIVDRNGKQVSNWKPANAPATTFSIASGNMLIYDIDANEMKIVGNNANRPHRYVNLLQNAYGKPNNGQLMWAYFQSKINTLTSSISTLASTEIPITVESRYAMKTNKCANQGLTIVGNELWHFHNSTESHQDYAYIMRFNIDTFQEIPAKQHNLGHAANVDYSVQNDAMLIANGSSNTKVLPRLDILLNPSNTDLKINYDDSNIISIPFFTDKKQIDGTGMVACWGEAKNQIYLFTGQNAPWTIYRVLLGMGINDYSDKTANQNDVKAWGTFISGKGENEFNGTAKILNKYIGTETGIYQGCCFRDGYIWLSVGYYVPEILKIKCYANGTYRIHDKIQLQVRDSADKIANCEVEGVCIDRDYMYVGLTGAQYGIAAIPIYGRQGGIGTTGEKTKFDFLANHNPNIQITPLSAVTDLYIESIDSNGFTVKSASNGTGKFNWTSYLS